ncbi:MAG: type II toxin-antitoxin system VapB family antitoxin [Tepidiformaceae bacterium]
MRTTIDLEDGLLRDARMAALESGRTLSAIVSDALREALARRDTACDDGWELPRFRPGAGQEGLLPGIDINDNAGLRDLLDEFDAVDRRQHPPS